MNIFGGRPGIAAGILAVIAILAASFLSFPAIAVLFIAAAAFVIICALLCAFGRITPYRLFANAVVTVVFCSALLSGMRIFYVDAPAAAELCGEGRYVHATVTERVTSGSYYTVYTVRLHSVDGEECGGRASLNCEYSSDLQEGYEFVLRGATVKYTLSEIDEDARSYVADEIFLLIETEDQDDCEILSEGNFSALSLVRRTNSYLSAVLRNGIGGEEGRLAAAMLLGDKDALTSKMYRDFSRAGLSHYLAVSGLHVSIITGVMSFILLRIRMSRRLRDLLISVFAVCYLFLLGFPVSAVRSVLMLLTVYFAYSLGDSSDSLNALGIAAAVIILIHPTVVFEKSFVLSFCATLGIVCFAPLLNELAASVFSGKRKKEDEGESSEKKQAGFWGKLAKRSVLFAAGTLTSVSAALSLTLLPVAFLFGESSVLGYRSNFAAVFAATPLLIASLLYLAAGRIPLIGTLLESFVRLASRYMLDLAARLSEGENALVSLASKEVCAVVLAFSALIFILMIVKVKNRKPMLIAPALYPLVIVLIMMTASSARPDTAELTLISTGKDESLLIACGEESALIDVTDGSYTRYNGVVTEAGRAGYTEFDTLILTHYHTKHLSSVSRFLDSNMVRRVVLPYPQTEDDAWIMVQLAGVAEAAGVACEIAEGFGETDLPGGITLLWTGILRLERSSHPKICFSFVGGGEMLTYVGESAWESEDGRIAERIEKSRVLIFGGHGPVAKTPFPIPCENAEEAVITDGALAEWLIASEGVARARGVVGAEKWKYVFAKEE